MYNNENKRQNSKQRMRIAIIGTIWINTPPPQYGGTEEVVSLLANGLVQKGHDVSLFAPATAHTTAHLSPTVTQPLREKDIFWNEISYHIYHMSQVFDRAHEFDVIHLHLNKNQDYLALPLAAASPTPVVTTLHFALPISRPDRKQLLMKYKNLPFTSISSSQRHGMPLNFIETVYNALVIEDFPFTPTPKNYVMWLGKIVPHKGTKEAILAAKKARIPIKIAGIVDKGVPESVTYFQKEVKPLLDGKMAEYMGEVGQPEKAKLLGRALALLNPIQWEEPFGLVMAEAQATGTPVIAFNRGSAKEIITNNVTGYLVDSVDEMAEKIATIGEITRSACRELVERKFSQQSMVEGYELAYKAGIKYWPIYQLNRKKTLLQYKDKPAMV